MDVSMLKIIIGINFTYPRQFYESEKARWDLHKNAMWFFLTNPGSNTPQNSSFMATCLSFHKPSKTNKNTYVAQRGGATNKGPYGTYTYLRHWFILDLRFLLRLAGSNKGER